MFQSNPENEKAVAAFLSLLVKHERGDIIPTTTLVKATGLVVDERFYRLLMQARRRHREATGIWSRMIPGVGLRLQTVEESATTEQHYRQRRSRHQTREGVKAVLGIDRNGLAENLRRGIENLIERAHHMTLDSQRLERELRSMEALSDYLARPAETRPKMRLTPPRPKKLG